jgi:hypothetical protein
MTRTKMEHPINRLYRLERIAERALKSGLECGSATRMFRAAHVLEIANKRMMALMDVTPFR